MNLASAPVIGSAAVLTSPALYGAFVTGTVPIDVAITRWLVALLICWVAISAVVMMVGPPPAPKQTVEGPAGSPQGTDGQSADASSSAL
ncbi:MAG: hypothetical protein CMH83_06490 [Nocardioides sp.]|nr:hypothetical protein [Nocardioides sp.]